MENKDIGLLLKNINDGVERIVNAFLSESEVTMVQARVLLFIDAQPNRTTTQKELEIFFNVSHPTINGILRRLEKKKYIITNITSENNHLSKQVVITGRGKIALITSGKSKAFVEKTLRKNLSAEEAKTLSNLLNKVLDSVKSMEE